MAVTMRTEGADELKRLASALVAAADRDLKKAVYARLKAAGAPLGAAVVREGVQTLPVRGGLQARIARYRTGITPTLTSRTSKVTLRLARVRGLDNGRLRHPVFGNRNVWVSQPVIPHKFTEAFERNAESVAPQVRAAVQDTLDEIARKV